MKTCTTCILLISIFIISSVNGYFRLPVRHRRDVGGSLDIVSNNVQPIHADVKPEMTVTEQVTPPITIFQQSLRKSLPPPSRLELVRSISRLGAVLVLAVTALVELYPALAHLVNTLYTFME